MVDFLVCVSPKSILVQREDGSRTMAENELGLVVVDTSRKRVYQTMTKPRGVKQIKEERHDGRLRGVDSG